MKLKCILSFTLILFSFVCGSEMFYGYRSYGVDRYSDGTIVRDGEIYGLIWIAKGHTFEGFRRDGTLIDSKNNEILYVRPLGKDGKCPPVNFVISDDFLNNHNGYFKIIAFDTRDVQGNPSYTNKHGKLIRVNSWCDANVHRSSVECGKNFNSTTDNVNGCIIGNPSFIPEYCRQPSISELSLLDKNNIHIGCVGTEPYMEYHLMGGTRLQELNTKLSAKNGIGTDDELQFDIEKNLIGNKTTYFFTIIVR